MKKAYIYNNKFSFKFHLYFYLNPSAVLVQWRRHFGGIHQRTGLFIIIIIYLFKLQMGLYYYYYLFKLQMGFYYYLFIYLFI
jgi:hypothetical protein